MAAHEDPRLPSAAPVLDWAGIDTILLDMDGTLLDKHFDDYFWEQYIPEHYSLLHDLPVEVAKEQLLARYHTVKNSLDWSDLHFWSRELGLDLPELKLRIQHLIAVHPHVEAFLEWCRREGKRLYLVTNAHPVALSIKLERTALSPWFDRIICADEVGWAKEEPVFWERLERILRYERKRTLLVDDTEKVLVTAHAYGLGHLLFIAQPSSRLRARHSVLFPSIESFREVLPG